jgi:hypothetical protein
VTVGDVVIPRGRMELHAGAHRILVFQSDPGPARWGWLWVFDSETKAKLAMAPIALDDTTTAFPRFSVSSDGARVGFAMGNIGMTEVSSGRTSYFEKRPAELAERDWPSAPIFASDGKHVCIKEHGAFTVLPMPTVAFLQTECFVFKRSDNAGTSAYDEEAIVANLPIPMGMSALAESERPESKVIPTALNADHSRVVVTEVSVRNAGSQVPIRMALLAYDLANQKTIARIAIPSVDALPDHFSVNIDEKHVGYCTRTNAQEKPTCFDYDLSSGALIKPPRH